MSESAMIDRLVGALRDLPDADARLTHGDIRPGNRHRLDAIVEAEIAERPLLLLVESKRDAYPRDVREAIWQLRNHQHHIRRPDREIIPFLVAGAISDGARETLRDEGVGYYDMGGTLFVPARGAYVFIDRAAPRKSRKIFDSIFLGQRARVLQTMFERKGDWLAIRDVSEAAEVSPATASQTLSELERREWVESRGSGPNKARRLVEPEKLVDAWTSYVRNQKPPKLDRFYVPKVDPDELMHQLDLACRRNDAEYAITGEAAAQAYTPYLTSISQIRCRMDMGGAGRAALDDLDARPVDEGWNLAAIEERPTNGKLMSDRRDGVNFAKPLQVYLDLLQGSGRSQDMAAHLRSEGLGLG